MLIQPEFEVRMVFRESASSIGMALPMDAHVFVPHSGHGSNVSALNGQCVEHPEHLREAIIAHASLTIFFIRSLIACQRGPRLSPQSTLERFFVKSGGS